MEAPDEAFLPFLIHNINKLLIGHAWFIMTSTSTHINANLNTAIIVFVNNLHEYCVLQRQPYVHYNLVFNDGKSFYKAGNQSNR